MAMALALPNHQKVHDALLTSAKRRQECHAHGGRAARALGSVGVSYCSPSLSVPYRSEQPLETPYRRLQGSDLS